MGHINFVGKTSSAVELVCQEAIQVLKITRWSCLIQSKGR
jgi:hypothetical protein